MTPQQHGNTGTSQYLCLFHVVTAGLLDDNMGSDEQEIIEIVQIIIDSDKRKVLAVNRQYVRPTLLTTLSDECKEQTGVDESLLCNELELDRTLQEFDLFLRERNLHPDSNNNINLVLVCDNNLHLRQCLHPEAVKKSITLPNYYWSYFDLRQDFNKFYRCECNSIQSMLEKLDIEQLPETDYCMRQAKHMELIVNKMLIDGYKFKDHEQIMMNLQQGICTLEDSIEESTVIRARGLPWQCTDQDVAKFFRGLNIERGGVALCLSSQGRRNGEALVRFISVEHRDLALRRHKHHIGQRYIEVYKASGRDFLNVAGGSNSEAQAFLQRDGQVLIRMRGLPFDATPKDVIEFFERGDNSCQIVDGEEGVLFVHYPDGRSTGDAFVMLKTENEASQALMKHKDIMGARYIELFRSTPAEVQQVFRRSQDPKNFQTSLKDIPFAPLPMLPPELISGGNKKDCIRVRNLPVESNIEQILEFLGVHSQHIVAQGVHMVYNAHGMPSGEAFIQMDSESAAYNASSHKHNKYMFFSGKKRYIEVLQCSGEDMNLVLLGLVPSNLIPTNLNNGPRPTMLPPRTAPVVSTMSTLPPQMIPQSLPIVAASQSSLQNGNSLAAATAMQNAANSLQNAYYPMPVFWYPTPPVSPPIYLQATGPLQNHPVLVLRGDTGEYSSATFN